MAAAPSSARPAATSLAPILLIVIAVAGLVVGRDAAQLAVSAQLAGLLGPQGADLLDAVVRGSCGYVILRNKLHITAVPVGDITLTRFDASGGSVGTPYNADRDLVMPDYFEWAPSEVNQIGGDFTGRVYVNVPGSAKKATEISHDVIVSGRCVIKPGRLSFESGNYLSDGTTPRFLVGSYAGETQIGDGMDVEISGVPQLTTFFAPISADADGAAGRYRVKVSDAVELSYFDFRPGATKEARLIRCNPSSPINKVGLVAALGDEVIDFEEIGVSSDGLLLNPFGAVLNRGNGLTVADGDYGPDGWCGLNEAASTFFSLNGNPAVGLPFDMRWTNPDVPPQRVGCVSFVPTADSVALRSRLVSLMATIRASTNMTVRYAIGEWTGTADAPTRDIVDDWSDTSYTAGGFFKATTTNVLTTGSIAATTSHKKIPPLHAMLGSAVTNIWVALWTESPIAQNAYFQFAGDLYPGWEKPLLRRRSAGDELVRCARYCEKKVVKAIIGTKYVPVTPKLRAGSASVFTGAAVTIGNITADEIEITHGSSALTTLLHEADIGV